jgi:hypothetical protein
LYLHTNLLTGAVPSLPFKQYNLSIFVTSKSGGCCLKYIHHTNRFTCPLPTGNTDCKCEGKPGVACEPGECRTTHHDGTAKSVVEVPWSDTMTGDFMLEVEVSNVNFSTSGCCYPIMSRRTKPFNESAGNEYAQFDLQFLNMIKNYTPHSLNMFMGNGVGPKSKPYGVMLQSKTLPFVSWTKLKMTIVGSTSTVFINGTKVASGTFSGLRFGTANPIYLGGYHNGGYQYYYGLMRNAMVNGKCLLH